MTARAEGVKAPSLAQRALATAAAQPGDEAIGVGRARRHGDWRAERPARTAELVADSARRLPGDGEQLGFDLGRLTGRLGEIPPVHDGLHRVDGDRDLARHLADGQQHLAFHHSGLVPGGRDRGRRGPVGGRGVVSVERDQSRARFDRFSSGGNREALVAGDHVLQQRSHVELGARRGKGEVLGPYVRHDALRDLQCVVVRLHDVHHSAPSGARSGPGSPPAARWARRSR